VRALEQVELGWDQRLSLDLLRESVSIGRSSVEFQRGDPEMLWLVSRDLNAIAYGHAPDDFMEIYSLAYETGFRCLTGNAGWLSRLESAGGAVTVAGVGRLTQADTPCLEQLVFAWIRLIEERGSHVYIDLPEISFLVGRLLEIMPDRWIGYWAQGMIGAFEDRPLAEIEVYMDLAYDKEPGLATATSDYLRISRAYSQLTVTEAPAEKFRRREFPVNDGHEWALENQRAVRVLFER
jgi:hypothetical protein